MTIYITLKWDPEHVFLSVRLHGQLMDKQKPTCFLFHCTISCLFDTGQRFLSGLSLCYLFFDRVTGLKTVLTFLLSPSKIFCFYY